mmetsp:Transcript_4618/g.15264  ORF Transcript_4618/g.15264 Transcript_4618/m.15264 type:complete len:292 (-) Transcript_4618:170-1045(-)
MQVVVGVVRHGHAREEARHDPTQVQRLAPQICHESQKSHHQKLPPHPRLPAASVELPHHHGTQQPGGDPNPKARGEEGEEGHGHPGQRAPRHCLPHGDCLDRPEEHDGGGIVEHAFPEHERVEPGGGFLIEHLQRGDAICGAEHDGERHAVPKGELEPKQGKDVADGTGDSEKVEDSPEDPEARDGHEVTEEPLLLHREPRVEDDGGQAHVEKNVGAPLEHPGGRPENEPCAPRENAQHTGHGGLGGVAPAAGLAPQQHRGEEEEDKEEVPPGGERLRSWDGGGHGGGAGS